MSSINTKGMRLLALGINTFMTLQTSSTESCGPIAYLY